MKGKKSIIVVSVQPHIVVMCTDTYSITTSTSCGHICFSILDGDTKFLGELLELLEILACSRSCGLVSFLEKLGTILADCIDCFLELRELFHFEIQAALRTLSPVKKTTTTKKLRCSRQSVVCFCLNVFFANLRNAWRDVIPVDLSQRITECWSDLLDNIAGYAKYMNLGKYSPDSALNVLPTDEITEAMSAELCVTSSQLQSQCTGLQVCCAQVDWS